MKILIGDKCKVKIYNAEDIPPRPQAPKPQKRNE